MKSLNASSNLQFTQDDRNAVSKSGTAGDCFAFCCIGIIVMAAVLTLMSVTGCFAFVV